MSAWYVYVIVSDNVHYVGCTTDVKRRLKQHNGKARGGAKFTRGRTWFLGVVYGPFPSRSKAQSAEACVKRYRGYKRLQVPELAVVRF